MENIIELTHLPFFDEHECLEIIQYIEEKENYLKQNLKDELDKKYRNIDKSTNVLSFSIANANISSELKMIGDIVISKEKILSEAKEQNKTFMSHLAHMVIHGFLHLLDFAHDSEEDSTIMEKKEIELLKLLNISNPYEDKV